MVRLAVQTAARAAAMTLLSDYAAFAGVKLQMYRGRPRNIAPPTAFPDRVTEDLSYATALRQRRVRVEVVVLHGLFDSGEAVDQADAFIDGFLDWVDERVHAAGANTTIGVVATENEPTFVVDWIPDRPHAAYFANRITLEVQAQT